MTDNLPKLSLLDDDIIQRFHMLINHFLNRIIPVFPLKQKLRNISKHLHKYPKRKPTRRSMRTDNNIELRGKFRCDIQLQIIEQSFVIKHFEKRVVLLVSKRAVVYKNSFDLGLMLCEDVMMSVVLHRVVVIKC